VINERTLYELVEKLQQCDELTILELLDLTSEELPIVLMDQVEERYDILLEFFDEPEDD
jgi:hypothetical protein